jgi:transcription initiation factor IIE alpha subunit
MNQTTLPQAVIDAGAMSIRIFTVLLTHEVMGEETIAEKAGIKRKSVSPAMTLLRRTGWVECDGEDENGNTD